MQKFGSKTLFTPLLNALRSCRKAVISAFVSTEGYNAPQSRAGFNAFIIAVAGLIAIFLLPTLSITPSNSPLFAKLVPECSNLSVGGRTVTQVCTICDLFKLIQNILNFAWIYITFPVATLMLAIGGFMMLVPGLSGEKGATSFSKGKKIITNALLGIVIVFLAWLGIDTLMKTVHGFQYNEGGGFGPWNAIQCQSQPLSTGGASETSGINGFNGISEVNGTANTNGNSTPLSESENIPNPEDFTCAAENISPETASITECMQTQSAAIGLILQNIVTGDVNDTCSVAAENTEISCHYGGTECNGVAHATDVSLPAGMRTKQNWDKLIQLARTKCGAAKTFCETKNGRTESGCNAAEIDHIQINDSGDCNCQ